ncbi:MAG: alpha/beta hydrolase [Polyangiaceae bacterium]|nr:alpha/beta hydrolase [Polyangiaceae bacterium]
MLEVETPRGRFHCLVEGPPDGPLALCLHGFPDVPHGMAGVQGALAARGHRAVAPFLRGYAPSVLDGPHDLSALGEDVVALVDALSPSRPASVVGHDWGAVAAYVALARAPGRFCRAVTMAVPHPYVFARDVARHPGQLARSWYMLAVQPSAGGWLLARRDHALVDRLVRAWSPGWTPEPRHLSRVKACLAESGDAPLALYRALLRPLAGARRRLAELRAMRISTPLLYLHGERDGCVGAALGEGNARMFDGPHERRVLAGLGHFLHMEAPLAVEAMIVEHLSR